MTTDSCLTDFQRTLSLLIIPVFASLGSAHHFELLNCLEQWFGEWVLREREVQWLVSKKGCRGKYKVSKRSLLRMISMWPSVLTLSPVCSQSFSKFCIVCKCLMEWICNLGLSLCWVRPQKFVQDSSVCPWKDSHIEFAYILSIYVWS